MSDFNIGDRARMKGLPPGVADITVTGVGICGDNGCTLPTVFYADPESGEPDEAHAEDFAHLP